MIKTIGTDGYGLWVLTYSLAAFGGIANFGMGLATQRFVALARAVNSEAASMKLEASIVAQTLVLATIGGAMLALMLLFGARLLADAFFRKMGEQPHVIIAIQTAGLVLACQQIEYVVVSGLRGLERFDLAAKTEALTKGIGASVVIATAFWSRSIEAVLIMTAAIAVSAVVAKCIVLRLALKTPIPIYAWRFPDRQLLRFGLWAWVQGIAATVFQQADRLFVSAALGAVALGTYSVASQVGALMHAGLSAMFAVVLPRLSRLMAAGDSSSSAHVFSQVWRRSVLINITAVFTLGLPLWIFGPALLHLWLGKMATIEVVRIYPFVLSAFLILSLNIAPHFVLLGAGSARYVSATNGAAAIFAIAVLYPAVSAFGLEGAALSRAFYGIVTVISYFFVLGRSDALLVPKGIV